jgi:hypothetical protein
MIHRSTKAASGTAMFGIDGFDPWTGLDGRYEASNPRLMVVGDIRLDAPLTDRESILREINGAPDLIFTNFEQAVLGRRHWEEGFSRTWPLESMASETSLPCFIAFAEKPSAIDLMSRTCV